MKFSIDFNNFWKLLQKEQNKRFNTAMYKCQKHIF